MSPIPETRNEFLAPNVVILYHEADGNELDECSGLTNAILIEDIQAKPQGRGHGTRALKTFLSAYADRNVIAQACPYTIAGDVERFDIAQSRLVRFYERFGFRHLGSGWIIKTIGKVGDCRDESIIEDIFGSVSEFARQVEENGDTFAYGKYFIEYDEKTDIHSFFLMS